MAYATVADLQAYLGIDLVDETISFNLQMALATAVYQLYGACGKSVPEDDPRAQTYVLLIAADHYTNRNMTDSRATGVNSRIGANMRKAAYELVVQLQLEYQSEPESEEVEDPEEPGDDSGV